MNPSKISMSHRSILSTKLDSKKSFKPRTLLKRRNDVAVFYDGRDVTPKLLDPIDSEIDYMTQSLEGRSLKSNFEYSFFGSLSTTLLQSQIHNQSVGTDSQYGSYLSIPQADIPESFQELEEETKTSSLDEGDFYPARTAPKSVNIVLTETPVTYLLDIPSLTEIKGTEEAEQIEIENERYDYLTTGKGRNRKTTDAEIQTTVKLMKSRATLARRCPKRSDYAFASTWDMYDTFEGKDDMSVLHQSEDIMSIELEDFEPSDSQMAQLLETPHFQHAVLVMERVLANNFFNQEQKRFRGLIKQDPFRPNIQFKYNLELLWTFKTRKVHNNPVTSMQWHPVNSDILAVGYGVFYYTDRKPGVVYCWNIKNPKQPEREYHFRTPVTSLAFSPFEPNLLAVGLYDGTVGVLDICRKKVDLLMMTNSYTTSSYEPIWQIEWFPPDDYNINDNHIICVCEDGRVCGFIPTKTNDLIQIHMLTTHPMEGKIKGVYYPKQCNSNEIPVSKACSALTITKHPTEPSVFCIGTADGTVRRCSENYQHQHLDVLRAHTGAVYQLQFSHFCPKLFLTCGGDSCINIWLEKVKEPLVKLPISFNPIECAEWCPANSTIIANICGNIIYLWDLQRKNYKATAQHKNPSNCRNTCMRFSTSGDNLAVGDIEGNVHIFTLTDMPFPPFYQARKLEEVLYKSLVTKPALLAQVKKRGLTT